MCSIDPDGNPAPHPVPLEQIEQEICELGAHIAAATCRWLLLIAEFDARDGWAEWGVNSCAHWLSWRCSVDLRSAREHVRVGRRLTELPLVRAAFASGELSYSKVRALTRVASAATEQDLVELARHATGAQLDKLVRSYGRVLSTTIEGARETHQRRSVTYEWQDDGSLRLQARLPADEGALVLAALKAAEQSAPAEPPDDGGSPATRRADALVATARASLAAGEGERRAGDPCELIVHVDAKTLSSDEVDDRSELADGPALAPETVRRLGCDAAVVRILERDGRPLSVGRRKRTITPALRRALQSRDGGCRFPGCTNTRFLHAHHIEHWAHGGVTSIDNLVHLCSHHHRLVHEGGYSVERVGEAGLRFRRPDGRVVTPSGPMVRARGAALEQRNADLGLRIDDQTCKPKSAGDPLDYGIAVEGLIWREQKGGP